MRYSRLWVSAAIVALAILISFALSVPHTRDPEVKSELIERTENVPMVSLSDSFKKGVHTISGWIEAPNACTVVSASTTLIGNASSTRGILVAITARSDSEVCLQVKTRTNFQTTISAPTGLPITTTINGSTATTTSPL